MKFGTCLGIALLGFGLTACRGPKPVAQQPETRVPVAPTPTPQPERQQTASTPAPAPVREAPPAAKSDYPDAKTKVEIDRLLALIQDAYFDYDKHSIRSDAEEALRTNARTLGEIIKDYPAFKITVEGHCDERGSDEYNVALGDARAKAAKEYLAQLGIPADQMLVKSYGRQQPICTASTEECWQKNRRAHLVSMARN